MPGFSDVNPEVVAVVVVDVVVVVVDEPNPNELNDEPNE